MTATEIAFCAAAGMAVAITIKALGFVGVEAYVLGFMGGGVIGYVIVWARGDLR